MPAPDKDNLGNNIWSLDHPFGNDPKWRWNEGKFIEKDGSWVYEDGELILQTNRGLTSPITANISLPLLTLYKTPDRKAPNTIPVKASGGIPIRAIRITPTEIAQPRA
jgi:hypothetical protein